jgi:Tol biopolymer transport system component
MGLTVTAAILIAILLFLLNRSPKTISVAPEIKLRQITTNSSENPVIGGAISPDGKYLAYSDMRGMHIKLLERSETRTVPDPEEMKGKHVKWGMIGWFPDSVWFLANAYPGTEEWNEWSSETSSVWSVSILGGAPTKLRDHALGCAVSPDGLTVAFATNKGDRGEREVWFMGPGESKPGDINQ